MNNLLCKGKGCNIRINNDSTHIFGQFYYCDFCNKKFCINCMYLYCSLCKKDFACFWCGYNHKKNNQYKYQNIKCKNCNI